MRFRKFIFLSELSHNLNIFLSALLLGSLIIFSGCSKNDEQKQPEPTQTIWQILESKAGLDSLAKYIALYPEIKVQLNSSGNITFFAPDNDAFAQLMDTPGFPDDISLINPEIIKGVLFYHILINNAYSSNDLQPGEEFDTAYPGEKITINEDGTILTGASNKNIQIVESDIKATNGYMHVTDAVLIPPTIGENITAIVGTVAGTLLLARDFSVFADAIIRADSSLETGQTPLTEILTTQNITVFAPPDKAFQAAGIIPDSLPGQVLRQLVLYHIINGTHPSADLTNRTYQTLQGENIYTSGQSIINGFAIAVPDAFSTSNGVIHILGGLLVPGILYGGDLIGVVQGQGFDSLDIALELTGLKNTLSAPNGPYTLFAPPDAAFTALLDSMSLTSLSQIPLNDLSGIISHHIVDGVVFASDMTDNGKLSTLTGVDLTVHITQTGIDITDGSGSSLPLIYINLNATNGVIHAIGGVLIPQ